MGSLMAGWDSPVHDPKAVKLERNRSLTKKNIETFWKSKKQIEEEHLRAISALLSPRTQQQENIIKSSTERKYERSNSLPVANTKENILDLETNDNQEKVIKKNGWWISSNWAFLNEPPVIASEGPAYKYASQFHVANIAASNSKSYSSQTGISTQ